MLAIIRFQHTPMGEAPLLGLLQASFSMNLPDSQALSRSRRFSAASDLAPPILYACTPTVDSLAIFFKQSDTTFECILEDSLQRAQTIYQICEYLVNQILRGPGEKHHKPKLTELYLEEDDGRRTDVSAQILTFWDFFRRQLTLRDWISQVVRLALLVGVAFWFASLLGAVYIGLIGLGAAVIGSALQACWDATRCKLQWRVG